MWKQTAWWCTRTVTDMKLRFTQVSNMSNSDMYNNDGGQ